MRAWNNYNVFVVGKKYLKDFAECACACSVTIRLSADRDHIRANFSSALQLLRFRERVKTNPTHFMNTCIQFGRQITKQFVEEKE